MKLYFEIAEHIFSNSKSYPSENAELYYATRIQESLVCIVQNEKAIVAVCLLIMDSKIEFIIEDFPDCCQKAGRWKYYFNIPYVMWWQSEMSVKDKKLSRWKS